MIRASLGVLRRGPDLSDRWMANALTRRRVLRATALGGAGLMSAALIGCGRKDEPPPRARTIKRGGNLRYAALQDSALDIMARTSSAPLFLAGAAYSGLLTRSFEGGKDVTIEPD